MLLLTIQLSLIINMLYGQNQHCPNGAGFDYCASQDGSCKVQPGGEGWLSFGANGKFTFMPYSKPLDKEVIFLCSGQLGDVALGVVKHCCFKNTGTGWATTYQDIIPQGGSKTFYNDYDGFRYGANGVYFYRAQTKTNTPCDHNYFSDPIFNTPKTCSYALNFPNWAGYSWSDCGGDGGNCGGLGSSNQYQWVRYGANGDYFYRLVSTNDGTIPCTHYLFNDPTPGITKRCERSAAMNINDAPASLRPNPINYEPKLPNLNWFDFKSIGDGDIVYGLSILLTVLLVINCLCLGYAHYKRRARKVQYQSVKVIDSESEIEAQPINV